MTAPFTDGVGGGVGHTAGRDNATALARHALGLDRQKASYRNRYAAAVGSPAHHEWLRMVEIGDAKVSDVRVGIGVQMFYLTRKGANAVLRDGESLCAEDFPASPDPRDPDHSKTGMFVLHNCYRCKDGTLPCVQGSHNRCEFPHARDD